MAENSVICQTLIHVEDKFISAELVHPHFILITTPAEHTD